MAGANLKLLSPKAIVKYSFFCGITPCHLTQYSRVKWS